MKNSVRIKINFVHKIFAEIYTALTGSGSKMTCLVQILEKIW